MQYDNSTIVLMEFVHHIERLQRSPSQLLQDGTFVVQFLTSFPLIVQRGLRFLKNVSISGTSSILVFAISDAMLGAT